MKALTPSTGCTVNHLRRGVTYSATTRGRTAVGEYLGIETPYGEKSILLRHSAGTESIALTEVTSIRQAA